MGPSKSELSRRIKLLAQSHGFDFCGIAKAEFLEGEATKAEEWLSRNYQGKMGYLEQNFDKRMDPTLLVPGAKSVISLVYNYYPNSQQKQSDSFKIAKYAYGRDYHKVLKKKLKLFFSDIEQEAGSSIDGRVFVDSAPVMERQWAERSGNGWIGKNGLLLNTHKGSFFFLAEVISDLDLEPDSPTKDYCGNCTKCLEACPTDAFPQPYVLDASKCISYFTIELKDQIPDEYSGKFQDWIFGCDICQDVCPWNRFSGPTQEPQFNSSDFLKSASKSDWKELTEDLFNEVFRGSPLKRSGYDGIMRNIDSQINNSTQSE